MDPLAEGLQAQPRHLGIGESRLTQQLLRLGRLQAPAPEGGEGRFLLGLFGLGRGEEAVELALDVAPVLVEGREKARPVAEAHGPGQTPPAQVVLGQTIGLLILPGLEAIFHAPQKDIGRVELLDGVGGQEAALPQQPQDRADGANLQLGIAPPAHELEGLADKLDLPDATRPQLDVVRHALALELLGDHGLHVADGFDGAKVQIAAIDEGPQQGRELFRLVPGTGHHPRLDHGVALPLPRLVLIVVLHGGKAHGQGTGVAKGSQTGIHAEDEAIDGGRVQGPHQTLPQPDKELLVSQRSGAIDLPRLRIGQDEVDVRGHIEFPRPQLAHADDQQPLRLALSIAGGPQFRPRPGLGQIQGLIDAHIRQFTEILQGLLQGGGPAQVPPDEAQHLAAAKEAQAMLEAHVIGACQPQVRKGRGQPLAHLARLVGAVQITRGQKLGEGLGVTGDGGGDKVTRLPDPGPGLLKSRIPGGGHVNPLPRRPVQPLPPEALRIGHGFRCHRHDFKPDLLRSRAVALVRIYLASTGRRTQTRRPGHQPSIASLTPLLAKILTSLTTK